MWYFDPLLSLPTGTIYLLVENGERLLHFVFARTFDGVRAVVEAGASVNGHLGTCFTPIMVATMVNHIGMVKYFVEEGVHRDKPTILHTGYEISGVGSVFPGERALHIKPNHISALQNFPSSSHGQRGGNSLDVLNKYNILPTCCLTLPRSSTHSPCETDGPSVFAAP